MEENNEQLQIIGKLYTDVYRAQLILKNFQTKMKEQEQELTNNKLQIQALQQDLDKSNTIITQLKNEPVQDK